METIHYEITGTAPLLMQSERTVNPFDPLTKAMKVITGKKKKTEEDKMDLARLEFEAGLYFDADLGPYIPGLNLDAMIRDAAKLSKLGKAVQRGTMVVEDKNRLEYDGPRSIAKLWADERFVDLRSAVVQRARIMRCRPIFRAWRVAFTVALDPKILDAAEVRRIVTDAGRYIGLGTYRPRFGRFEVTGDD
ncbi:MAG TPA: hypothetical protein ENH55_16625 [Aurantimonas coralicida]|uniref:Uncharacterized protein n=2 Tax=root TaxID=1 RepID=A0A9C9NED3_9HYPH|nr:hypothetical protein [Aurantimonas coralicida]HEU00530.1 hypothetical protein [Aurantimonas coralicida]